MEQLIKIEFRQADLDLLQTERHEHPHPRVRQRLETGYLKALGYPHQEIGRIVIVGISQKTLRSYLCLYQSGGIDALKHLKFYRPVSAIETHRDTLSAEFTRQPLTKLWSG